MICTTERHKQPNSSHPTDPNFLLQNKSSSIKRNENTHQPRVAFITYNKIIQPGIFVNINKNNSEISNKNNN